MPYSLSKTNGTVLTIINDGTVDNTTDLVFIGKNYTGYGDPVNENFIKLLENFADITPPKRPLVGQIWFDATTNRLKVFTGSNYKHVAVISTGNSFPIDATTGDMHFNGSLFSAYNGVTWIPIGPLAATSSGGGAELPTTSVITESQSVRDAISIALNNESVVVLSTSSAYSVYSADPLYNKYPGIYPGMNLPDTDDNGISAYYDSGSNIGNLFWGTAGSALGLVDYSSSTARLIRSTDILLKNNLSSLGSLAINDDDGILINEVFRLHVTRNQGIAASAISNIKNNIIKFNINTVNGTYTNFINFDAGSGVFRVLPTTATSVTLGSPTLNERFSDLYVKNIYSDLASITTVTSARMNGTVVSATQMTVTSNVYVGGSLQIGTTSTINNARIWTTATLYDNSQLTNGAGYLTAATVSAYGVSSVKGTTNQINVSSTTGNVTLSLSNNLAISTMTGATLYADDNIYVKVAGIYKPVLTEATLPSGGVVNVVGTTGQVTTTRVGGVITIGLPEEVTVTTLRGSALYDNNNRVLTGATAVTSFSAGTTGLTPYGANTGAITLGGTLGVPNGGTGASSLTGYLKGNGTGAFTAVAKVPYADLSGAPTNVSSFANDAGYITRSFETGVKMLFVQSAAPLGWTQVVDANLNDRALRVVTSTGGGTNGTVDFSAAFTSQAVSGTVGDTTLTIDQIPSHTHTAGIQSKTVDAGGSATFSIPGNSASAFVSGATGGGQPHTHSFSAPSINLAVKYVDVIIASKN